MHKPKPKLHHSTPLQSQNQTETKLRLRDVETATEDHKADQYWQWDLNLVLLDSKDDDVLSPTLCWTLSWHLVPF